MSKFTKYLDTLSIPETTDEFKISSLKEELETLNQQIVSMMDRNEEYSKTLRRIHEIEKALKNDRKQYKSRKRFNFENN